MIVVPRVLAIVGSLLLASPVTADEATETDRFDALGFLVGHCWRGEFGDGRVDTQCYDLLYDGAFVRSRHEVARDGDDGRRYGGVTMFSWDGTHKRIRFHYFTSTGSVSEGHFASSDEDGLVIPERHVAPDGKVIEIETRYQPLGDDAYSVVARSRTQDGWRVMFEATYRRVAAAD